MDRSRYEAYGANVNIAGSTNPVGLGFTGHVNDADIGLTYMQQRYYDPVAARFLSKDPVLTDANTGASFNRYAYANNNPYRFVDPDGRCPVAKDGVECKAVLAPGIKITDGKLVKGLNKIAAEVDKQIDVYSGNRDASKNAKVGRAKDSAHVAGNGADFTIKGMTKPEIAKAIKNSDARKEAGIREVHHTGKGLLPEHTHLDTKSGADIQENKGGVYSPLTILDEKK